MQLLKRNFDSFDSVTFWVEGLSKAINTTLIPNGESIEEVYASFLKIQLGRRFNPNWGFGSANLEMVFNEKEVVINYISTSGTQVIVSYKFDEDMKFKCGEVECWIPDDRVKVGRCHYELITQLIYKYNWSRDGEVMVPIELRSLNPDWEVFDFPTPTWVLDELENKRARSNPEERDAQLLKFGYTPVAKPIGFSRIWSNPGAKYPYILFQGSLSPEEYIILREDSFVSDFSVSYRRLLEILQEHSTEEEAKAEEVIDDYDYDYDEYVEDEE